MKKAQFDSDQAVVGASYPPPHNGNAVAARPGH